jgi:hypothetical protein
VGECAHVSAAALKLAPIQNPERGATAVLVATDTLAR